MSKTVAGTDLSSLITQVQSLAAQNAGSSSAGAWFNNYSDLWTYAKTLEEGNSDQKAQAATGLMQKIISFASSAIANREAEAQKTSTKNNNDAQKASNKQKDAKAELDKKIDEVNGKVETNLSNINSLIEDLKSQGENVSSYEAEVENIKKDIEKKQEELKSEQDPEKQQQILDELSALTEKLDGVYAKVQAASEETEKTATEAEDVEKEMENNIEEGASAIEDSVDEVNEIAAESGQVATQNVQASQQATQDAQAGTVYEAMAATMAASSVFSFGATSGQAARYQMLATDAFAGSSTGFSGAISSQQTVLNCLGGLQGNLQALSTFANGLGGYNSDFSGSLDAFNAFKNPLLTSIGSFSSIPSVTQNMEQNIESDKERISAAEQEEREESAGQTGESNSSSGSELASAQTDTSGLDEVRVEEE